MKPLYTFVLGAVLASGVVYYVAAPSRQPEPAPVVTQAPVPTVPAVETPTEAEAKPEPAPEATPPPPAPVRKPSAMSSVRNPEPKRTASTPPKPQAASPKQESAPPPASQPAEKPATTVAENRRPDGPAPQPLHWPDEAPKPPARVAATVTIPVGTVIAVRLDEELDSTKNQTGDQFRAIIDQPLVVDGMVLAERGARAMGKVTSVDPGGRVKGRAEMTIELTQISTSDGQKVNLRTDTFVRQATSDTKGDAAKVGGAAAVGAIIGAIAGGGKGAAIGAGVGGAAGAGGVIATRGRAAHLPIETKLSFRVSSPVTVTEKLR